MCGENRKASGEAAIFYSQPEDEATNTHTLSEYKKRNGRKTTGISE